MICRAYLIYSDHSDKVYIGSTEWTVKKRLGYHIRDRNCYATILIDLGDYDIIELEEFECDTFEQQRMVEQEWMNCYPGMLVNDRRAHITLKQLKQQQREYHREYLQKTEVKAKRRENYHKPEVKAKVKAYNELPEVKKRAKELQRERRKKPEVKARRKARRQKPEVKKRTNEVQRLRREWKRIHINNINPDLLK